MSYTIYRIPPHTLRHCQCGSWFPLPAGEYYANYNDDPTHRDLRPVGTGTEKVFERYTVRAAHLAPYAVELVEKPQHPHIGIHVRDTALLQEVMLLAAVANPQGGTPEDDLAFVLEYFKVRHGEEKT